MSEDLESTFRPKQWCDGCSLPDVEGCWCAWCRLGHGLCHHCYRRWNIRKRPRSIRPVDENAGLMTLDQMKEKAKPLIHVPTGCEELDRVLASGILRGHSTFLWGGSGGGKTSLLMRAAAHMAAATGEKVVYASSEQHRDALAAYAERMGLSGDSIFFLPSERDVGKVLNLVEQMRPKPLALVYDSIAEAMYADEDGNGTMGTHTTLLAVADHLKEWSHSYGVATILTIHATNGGEIKGGMAVVHKADVVMELQPTPTTNTPLPTDHLRLLRCTKNRDGKVPMVDHLAMDESGAGLRTLTDAERKLVSRLA